MQIAQYNFTQDFQDSILACLIRYPQEFYAFGEIIKPEYFTGPAATELVFRWKDYQKNFSKFPNFTTLGNYAFHEAIKVNIDHAKETMDYVEKLAATDTSDKEGILAMSIQFASERAIYDAIRKIHTAQTEGKAGNINPVKVMQDAMAVGMNTQDLPTLNDVLQRDSDPKHSLLGDRFLTKGAALIISGPTGVGKSSLVIQGSICFALGRDFLGIKPTHSGTALRSLIIQAENDEDDVREMIQGACEGLDLTNKERKFALERVTIVTEMRTSGEAFLSSLQSKIAVAKPHLVWIDPLLAFLGEAVVEQEAVSKFLRQGIDPIIKRAGCGLIILHHTNKPLMGKQKIELQTGDYAYLGAGSAELANYPRAVIGLQPTASPDIFTMLLGKRGRRLGIKDSEGRPVSKIHIKQHPKIIFWNTADAVDMEKLDNDEAELTTVLRLIPDDDPISQEKLLTTKRNGIGINRFKTVLNVLVEQGKLFVWRPKGKKTGPSKYYAKYSMPEDYDWPHTAL